MQRSIVSDEEALFTSAFCKELTELLGTWLATSTAYCPASENQTERITRTLDDMLRHFVGPAQENCDEHLDATKFDIA